MKEKHSRRLLTWLLCTCLLLSLLGGRMMPNGINALVMSRADFSVEDKMLIKEKFSKLNFPVSTQTKA